MLDLIYADDGPDYLVTGTHLYPSAPGKSKSENAELKLIAQNCIFQRGLIMYFLMFSGVALTADTQIQTMPSEASVHSMALALPPSQAR